MPERPAKLINLTPIQIKYKKDWDHRFLIISAGRRSRKTLIGRRKILIKATANPNTRYFHAAPTHKQAKDIFWENLKKDYAFCMVKKSETALSIDLVNGSQVIVVGLDKPERIEGQTPSFDGCHITEYPNLKDGVFHNHLYPILSDTNGFGIFDGVPEGRNHYYDLALKACDNVIPKTEPLTGAFAESGEWAFYTWFSSDVLNPAIIAQAKMDLDERTFNQEYRGQFVDYAGLAYYAFGKHNLRECIYDSNRRISVGIDFNVDPMTCVIGHILKDKFYQFDEMYINNSNTEELAELFKRKYPVRATDVYPDSTGDADTANASKSNLKILEDHGFNIFANKANPFVIDRVNCVNSRIKIMPGNVKYPDGLSRYYVNPTTCPQTIADFQKVTRDEDGTLDKKQEKKGLKHISDALGYLMNYNWPLKESIRLLT